jgi:DNA-binding transcriptional ArsR family regulator
MRHDSALKVIAFLRENLGRPVSILEVCRGIDLSYQPTHGHIRELEELGVVVTERRGRQVCCALNGSDAAAIWLALESEVRWREIGGEVKRLGEALRADLTQTLRGKLLSVVVAMEPDRPRQRVWVLVAEPSARRQAEEVSTWVGERLRRPLEVAVGTSDDLLRWLHDDAQGRTLRLGALPIYGRERFWELMLAGTPRSPSTPPPVPPTLADAGRGRDDDFID